MPWCRGGQPCCDGSYHARPLPVIPELPAHEGAEPDGSLPATLPSTSDGPNGFCSCFHRTDTSKRSSPSRPIVILRRSITAGIASASTRTRRCSTRTGRCRKRWSMPAVDSGMPTRTGACCTSSARCPRVVPSTTGELRSGLDGLDRAIGPPPSSTGRPAGASRPRLELGVTSSAWRRLLDPRSAVAARATGEVRSAA